MSHVKLNALAFGLACGVLWGISIFLMGLSSYFFSYGELFVSSMGTLYIGYEGTLLGSFIGGLIGFVDAFIGGVVLAWLYNVFLGCSCCHKNCESNPEQE